MLLDLFLIGLVVNLSLALGLYLMAKSIFGLVDSG
jgi:hypothetical protein